VRISLKWNSGSQSVLLGSEGIRAQFPDDPWIHFVKANFKFTYFQNSVYQQKQLLLNI